MGIKVVKFGGSSLADADHFRQVADIIKCDKKRRYVVASAPGKRYKEDIKVTDMLYNCYDMFKRGENIDLYFDSIKERYNGIIKDLGMSFNIDGELEFVKNAMTHASGRDYAASRGEYLNSIILAKYLGFDFVDAENVIFFKENGTFDSEKTNEILSEELKKHKYAVVPGFYGVMPNGTIKTFSRGGSDVTGSIVARAVKAELYENWTDVSGFMMTDPRIVENPLPISTITYRELRELSYMGATVLHEDAIFPVRECGIPINIRNTNKPLDEGTMILPSSNTYDSKHVITGIAGKKGFSVISVEKVHMHSEIGFVRRIFECLEDNDISFEHIPSGIDTVSVIVSNQDLKGKEEKILASLQRNIKADNLSIRDGVALIAVVGRGMIESKGTAAKIFKACFEADVNIQMIDQGSSEINIIIGVAENDYEKAVKAIYSAFVK